MFRQQAGRRRFVGQLSCSILAMALVAPACGQSRVIAIEEHWELELGRPVADQSSFQTTMVLSPVGDESGLRFLFTLNHVTIPAYQPGGMQVQVWDGEQLIDTATLHAGAISYDDEMVRWAQRVTLDEGALKFEISQGSSKTWGDFGGEDLSLQHEFPQAGLNGYRPGISLTESRVNYAENRGATLRLTKVVWVTDDGETHTLTAPIPLDTSLDR